MKVTVIKEMEDSERKWSREIIMIQKIKSFQNQSKKFAFYSDSVPLEDREQEVEWSMESEWAGNEKTGTTRIKRTF